MNKTLKIWTGDQPQRRGIGFAVAGNEWKWTVSGKFYSEPSVTEVEFAVEFNEVADAEMYAPWAVSGYTWIRASLIDGTLTGPRSPVDRNVPHPGLLDLIHRWIESNNHGLVKEMRDTGTAYKKIDAPVHSEPSPVSAEFESKEAYLRYLEDCQ